MKLFCCVTILFIVSFRGLSQYYKTNPKFANQSPAGNRCLVLDSTYNYYIRELYKSVDKGHKTHKDFLNGANSKKDLIEIEYLFVSTSHHNVIYISTVPDKFQKYYSDTGKYLGDAFVNVKDFRRFLFGKLKEDRQYEFETVGRKTIEQWNIEKKESNGDSFVMLNTVEKFVKNKYAELIPVAHVLENEVAFRKVKTPFTLLFYCADKPNYRPICSDRSICITEQNGKFEVVIQFDDQVSENGNKVYFDFHKIPFSPVPLFR